MCALHGRRQADARHDDGRPKPWHRESPLSTPRALHFAGWTAATAYGALAWASHTGHPSLIWWLLACMGVAWTGTLIAARAAGKSSAFLRVVWSYGILFRAIGFVSPPVLEDDFYRFLWDGRMFAISGTPYGKAPADFFEEPGLGERFEWILNGINHPDLPTVYGPVCELAFLAAYLIAPGRLWPLKLMLIVADLAAIALLRRALRPAGMVLWAWCPLLIHEIAFSAHPDALGIAAMAGALACASLRARQKTVNHAAGAGTRAWAIGLWMAIAAGARPFAVLLLPFLMHRDWWKSLAAFAGVSLVLHIPLLLAPDGLSGLTAFAGQWEFNSSGFALLQAAFGTEAAKALGMLIFAGAYSLLLARWWRGRLTAEFQVPHGDWIFGALLLVSPVVNPWYVLWLLPFVALRPAAWSVTLLIMISLSYCTGANIGSGDVHGFNHPQWVRPVEYGAVLLAAIVEWRRRAKA